MKNRWPRGADFLELDVRTLGALIQPAFPSHRVENARPLDEGLSNTNYHLNITGRAAPIRLRIAVTRPEASGLEAALCRRLRPRVPVPDSLWLAGSNPITGHPQAIFDWIEGVALDGLLAAARADTVAEVGRELGSVLAAIGSHTFEAAGFLDGRLEVAVPLSLDREAFRAYSHRDLIDGEAAALAPNSPYASGGSCRPSRRCWTAWEESLAWSTATSTGRILSSYGREADGRSPGSWTGSMPSPSSGLRSAISHRSSAA